MAKMRTIHGHTIFIGEQAIPIGVTNQGRYMTEETMAKLQIANGLTHLSGRAMI